MSLPEKIEDLKKALFALHRQIDKQYLHVPWPTKIQNIIVLTAIESGKGDSDYSAKDVFVAALKRISKICVNF